MVTLGEFGSWYQSLSKTAEGEDYERKDNLNKYSKDAGDKDVEVKQS